jgi:hypothetical protein
MKSFLRFESLTSNTVTRRWAVKSDQSGCILGMIKWHAPWRRYAFFPLGETLFDFACMQELTCFIGGAMDGYRDQRGL